MGTDTRIINYESENILLEMFAEPNYNIYASYKNWVIKLRGKCFYTK